MKYLKFLNITLRENSKVKEFVKKLIGQNRRIPVRLAFLLLTQIAEYKERILNKILKISFFKKIFEYLITQRNQIIESKKEKRKRKIINKREKLKREIIIAGLTFEDLYNDCILKMETARLLAKQMNESYFNRMDVIVRYLAIENYYDKNDYGFILYNKMQYKRNPNKKEVNWIERYTNLIESIERFGFHPTNYVEIDENHQLIDGSHRLACALYYNEKDVSIKISSRKIKVDYGIEWFKENGFASEEIEIIKKKKNEILRKCGIKNLIIREKLLKILNTKKQTFGRGKFYQSLPQLNIIGQRPTEKRFKIYELENILNKDQEVLDIGCNVGFFDIFISKHIKHIDGIDINKKLIYIGNIVKNYLKINNISFYHCSFEDFKLDKKYNIIFLFAIYHWTSYSFTEFLFKVKKLLKPNGYIIIESHNIHTIDKKFDERISYMEKMSLKKLWDGKIKDDGNIERRYAILQSKM